MSIVSKNWFRSLTYSQAPSIAVYFLLLFFGVPFQLRGFIFLGVLTVLSVWTGIYFPLLDRKALAAANKQPEALPE